MISSDEYSPTTLVGSEHSVKTLLFGEIDTSSHSCKASSYRLLNHPLAFSNNALAALRSNKSICNLTFSSSPSFLKFWLSETIRDQFLGLLDRQDLGNLRLVCNDFSNRAAPLLFKEITVAFDANIFTKPSRVAALSRIGFYVQTLTFDFPHSNDTFLPPLIDLETGEELNFIYTPQINTPSKLLDRIRQPKYGSWETADLLVKQYPPLFHASTNVPAFIKAFQSLPNLAHLKISCPSTGYLPQCHRSVVDYALISLRIAVEQAPLEQLDTLSFLPIHTAGLFYFQPLMGFGTSPKAAKKWARIRNIAMQMERLDEHPNARMEQLKVLHSYLRNFSGCLHRLLFRWEGSKGPSPLSLDAEPCLNVARNGQAHICAESPRALRFRQLKHMELENACMDATQVSSFISRHRRTLEVFNFDHIKLRSGDWDEALSPLSRICGNDTWKMKHVEVMEVPIILSRSNLANKSLVDLLSEQQTVDRETPSTLCGWITRARSIRVTSKAREQLVNGSEHMKRILRSSMSIWR